ncbi:hypothetical protein THAOC_10456, partial [Thalassiosira oceanica]
KVLTSGPASGKVLTSGPAFRKGTYLWTRIYSFLLLLLLLLLLSSQGQRA